ncbi:MAG: CapA family protein [Blautia sp.]|jgi:poly-gamma-glutamate capsule biosynthesis protein CapA/YwtB (metallophosphatase superfamily)
MKRPDINTPLNFTEKYKSRISLIVSVITMLVLCLFLGQMDKIFIQTPKKEKAKQEKQLEEQDQAAQAAPEVYTASFVAVGDNRFSSSLISSGYNEETDSYNFDPIYSKIQSEISGADFALVNQETVFTEDPDSYSGEDTFASPTAVGDALVNAGFDGIACASDHMDDFGSSMITETLNYWNTAHPDVHILGIHPSETDAGTITVVDVNNIKVALLDYTGSSYTAQLEDDETYMIDQLEKTKVSADIAKAKAESDCIIVYANWGDDDSSEVSDTQKQWASFFLSQGVQVTIGVNPRQVQPFETLTDASGNSMLVYYSLGNFVSTQGEIPRLLEGMAKFTIEKTVAAGASSAADTLDPNTTPTATPASGDSLTPTAAPDTSVTPATEPDASMTPTVTPASTTPAGDASVTPSTQPDASQTPDSTGAQGSVSTTNGTVTIRITASSLEPMVMHYNYDENIYEVYMLSQYTDELAENHSIHDMIEDEFTIASLQSLFQTKTHAETGTTGSADSTGDLDNDSDNGSDDGYDDGSDSGYDDGSGDGYDDGSDSGYDDGSGDGYDDGSDSGYDDGSVDGYDDGSDSGSEESSYE